MKNTWENIGDVNPREHGGIFFRQDYDTITVVETNNLDECGCPGQYRIFEREMEVEEIDELWDDFCAGKEVSVATFADWDTLRNVPVCLRRARIVADMLSYYGSDCYPNTVTNYWKELKKFGIYPRHS